MEKEPITSQGLVKVKEELENLKNIKRPKIIEAIAEARGHGDLKENAEYHAAKEEQSKIESRIIEINNLIANANLIDVTKLEKKETVIFGSTVSVIDLENNQAIKTDPRQIKSAYRKAYSNFCNQYKCKFLTFHVFILVEAKL